MTKEDNSILLNMIKNKSYKDSLKLMEKYLEEELNIKLNIKPNENNYSFMDFLDYCIRKVPSYYDILTYIRNLYFFSEKTDEEKLNEIINIYINLKEYNS